MLFVLGETKFDGTEMSFCTVQVDVHEPGRDALSNAADPQAGNVSETGLPQSDGVHMSAMLSPSVQQVCALHICDGGCVKNERRQALCRDSLNNNNKRPCNQTTNNLPQGKDPPPSSGDHRRSSGEKTERRAEG